MAHREQIHRRLRLALGRFKLDEIKNEVLEEFPETTWQTLAKEIVQSRRPMSAKLVIEILLKNIIDQNLNLMELKERCLILELSALSRSTSKTWKAYKLVGEANVRIGSTTELLDSIKGAVRRQGLRADVEMLSKNDKHIVAISLNQGSTAYFSVFLNRQYFFTQNKAIKKELITALTKGLGFDSFKDCHLYGKDIKSLLRLLQNKENQMTGALVNMKSPKYRANQPTHSRKCIDYTQGTGRAKYVDECYGEDPPKLETLTIDTKNNRWIGADDDPMNGVKFNIKVQFASPNVLNMIKKMAQNDQIEVPLPDYLENFISMGKNNVNLRDTTLETHGSGM